MATLRYRIFFSATLILLFAMLQTPIASAANWWEKVKMKGDLRYRHETIKKEDKDARNRHRIRARFGIFAKTNDMFNIGIQLASGSDDPVSTNQTLDGAFSTKDLRLDLAYFKFQNEQLPGLTIAAGKIKNPFFKPGKSELIWDGDWNPEGCAASFEHDTDKFGLNLIGSGFWIDERSSSDDSYIVSGQAAAKLKLNESKSQLTFGGGLFNYVNAKGYQPFFDTDKSMGNSLMDIEVDGDTVAVYANDYELVEIFAELKQKFESVPVTIMGDFVTNTAADSLNTGWLIGLKVGKAKKTGTWEFRYIYREFEKDAVIGIFADSDFRGGGTDGKGHEVGGAYQLADKTALKISYFLNKNNISDSQNEKDFNRLQVDLQLKF